MGRKKRGIRKNIEIDNKFYLRMLTISVVVILLIFNVAILLNLMGTNKELETVYKNIHNNVEDYKDIVEKYGLLSDEINGKKEKFDNIDQSLLEVKKSFFDNAKLLEEKIVNNESDAKIAYITIDDGPYPLTKKFLDVLKEKNVQATFFSLARDGYADIHKRIVDEGHTQANHTFSHNIHGTNGIYRSSNNFINDVLKMEKWLFDITGLKTDIVRFPGGSSTAGGLKSSIVANLKSHGYGYVDWDVDIGDGAKVGPSASQSKSNVLNGINGKDIAVILMHDYNETSLRVLPDIIDELKNRGYIFLPLFKESIKVIK